MRCGGTSTGSLFRTSYPSSAADLVLRPSFQRTIDTLDFNARHVCIAAGLRAVREHRDNLMRLLTQPAAPPASASRNA